jgi:hypothetical protein
MPAYEQDRGLGQGHGMTSFVTERFGGSRTPRSTRALELAGQRAGDVLAGRTVWCARSLPRARGPAEELRGHMQGAAPDASAATLPLEPDEQMRGLAERVEDMLEGVGSGWPDLGEAERDAYVRAAGSDGLSGAGISGEDVVVVHDALSAIAIQPARERGAHAVWRIQLQREPASAARQALAFLQAFAPGIDAYLLRWQERGSRGEALERVGAALPSAGLLAAKEFQIRAGHYEQRRLAWRMALAEIVRNDRGERVGGTIQPCPSVASR